MFLHLIFIYLKKNHVRFSHLIFNPTESFWIRKKKSIYLKACHTLTTTYEILPDCTAYIQTKMFCCITLVYKSFSNQSRKSSLKSLIDYFCSIQNKTCLEKKQIFASLITTMSSHVIQISCEAKFYFLQKIHFVVSFTKTDTKSLVNFMSFNFSLPCARFTVKQIKV